MSQSFTLLYHSGKKSSNPPPTRKVYLIKYPTRTYSFGLPAAKNPQNWSMTQQNPTVVMRAGGPKYEPVLNPFCKQLSCLSKPQYTLEERKKHLTCQ